MKAKRHRKIIELISQYNIETQEELAGYLVKEGFNVTQATVSRDIRELHLSKVAVPGGGSKYVLAGGKEVTSDSKYIRVLRDGFVSMDNGGNIIVIKTVSGMAMAVAAALDALKFDGILGSIAGDDTIMCAVKYQEQVDLVMKNLEKIVSK